MIIPRLAYQLSVHGGLIVGSQARVLAGESIETNDWDILVPFDKWQVAALLIPDSATLNKFGGWRFKQEDGIEYDVWPGSLQEYLTNCRSKHGGTVYAVDFIHNKVYSASGMQESPNEQA